MLQLFYMKRHKQLLLQIGIIFFIAATLFYVLEQRTKFIAIDFSKHYALNKTIELSGFEEAENWQGNYSYNSGRVLEGKSSIVFSSWYAKENSIQNNVVTSLSPGYTNGYISIYVANKDRLSSMKSLSLVLTGEQEQTKEFDLAPDLQVGWNRIAIPIPAWKKITKKQLSITSQPKVIAEIILDRFWIENTTAYTSDVISTSGKFLSLRTIGERTYLFSASAESEKYYPIATPSLQKGSVTFSLIPEHATAMSLALNGTSMSIFQKNDAACVLSKNGSQTATKTLQKMSGKNDLYVFLRASIQGEKIEYSISNNGVDFESCGSVQSTKKTPIHLSLQGAVLIDAYSAEY